jgi:AcrR family transcriptional regulator
MTNQRRRTRQAILAACRELLAEGVEPTMGVVAERALVGRATIYRYFPALKHLLFEASLANTEYDIDSILEDTAEIEDPEIRLRVVAGALCRRVSENETSYRRLLQFSLANAGPGHETRPEQIRGVRRLHWLAQALEPYRARFDQAAYDRLIRGLAAIVGIESLVALRDLCDLDADEAEQVILWSVSAMLRHALSSG